MGLHIWAYSQLQPFDAVVFEGAIEGMDYDEYVIPHVNPDFPTRALGVKDKQPYRYGTINSFSAGSYGGYNNWRNQLAELAGYPERTLEYVDEHMLHPRTGHDVGAWQADGGPFWELILFSDCEGIVGPVVSAKIAKDFADYEAKMLADDRFDDYFRRMYYEWKAAFELGADSGCVEFG